MLTTKEQAKKKDKNFSTLSALRTQSSERMNVGPFEWRMQNFKTQNQKNEWRIFGYKALGKRHR